MLKISLVVGTAPAILGTFSGSLQEVAEKITQSDWCPGTFSDGHRHAESWEGSDLLAFDIDEGLALADAVARLESRGLQHVVATSKSHQKQKGKKGPCDRFRVLMPLAERITDPAVWAATWKLWRDDLFPETDRAAKDPARFFYASPEVMAGDDAGDRAMLSGGRPEPKPATPEQRAKADERLAGIPMPERLMRATTYARAVVKKGGVAVEGEGGDNQTLYVARACGWDFGLPEDLCHYVLRTEWNPHCQPPWSDAALAEKIVNAYRYNPARAFGCKLLETAPLDEIQKIEIDEQLDHVSSGKPPVAPVDPDQKEWTPELLLGTTVACLDERFRMMRAPQGPPNIIFLRIDDRNQAQVLGEKPDLDFARHLAERYAEHERGIVLTERTVKTTIFHWKSAGTLLRAEPLPLTFSGDDRLSWCRVPWTPEAGDWSAWREFTDRCSDPGAVMAYVGACFTPESKTRQALYLKGDGKDGKSTVINVILEALGVGSGAINDIAVSKSERFLLSTIFGKRVVGYADCKLQSFSDSTTFRAIVSGDPQSIEFKGVGAFLSKIQCRLIVGTNYEPKVPSDRASQSRMILIDVAQSQNMDDPTWADRLRAQLPAFVFECLKVYAERCPRNGDILVNEAVQEAIEAASEDSEGPLLDLIVRHFELHPEGIVSMKAFREAIREEFGEKAHDLGRLRKWLEGRGVTRGWITTAGGRDRCFKGLRLKRQLGAPKPIASGPVQVPVATA